MESKKQIINDLEYDGKISSYYKIWIINIIFSILTLGIYSFWGKTKLRKYSASSFWEIDSSTQEPEESYLKDF
jgi:uncharacterized membrane protein YjgN (DUF898 family)